MPIYTREIILTDSSVNIRKWYPSLRTPDSAVAEVCLTPNWDKQVFYSWIIVNFWLMEKMLRQCFHCVRKASTLTASFVWNNFWKPQLRSFWRHVEETRPSCNAGVCSSKCTHFFSKSPGNCDFQTPSSPWRSVEDHTPADLTWVKVGVSLCSELCKFSACFPPCDLLSLTRCSSFAH